MTTTASSSRHTAKTSSGNRIPGATPARGGAGGRAERNSSVTDTRSDTSHAQGGHPSADATGGSAEEHAQDVPCGERWGRRDCRSKDDEGRQRTADIPPST